MGSPLLAGGAFGSVLVPSAGGGGGWVGGYV